MLTRVEVDGYDGGVILYVGRDGDPDIRCGAVASSLVAEVAEMLGCSLHDARVTCIALLAERVAEDRAYAHACERLGVLL